MLRIEGSPALSGCLMNIWWAHQSSSGGADFRSPDPGALPPGALNTARRLTYGIEWTGAAKNRFLAEFLERDSGELSKPIIPSLDDRPLTMQPCIKVRTANLCPFASVANLALLVNIRLWT